MSQAQSEARKKYWASIPASERTKKAQSMAVKKWKGMSKEDRVKHNRMLLKAKEEKHG